MDELSPLERDYLRGMAQCMSTSHVIDTAAVANALGKDQQQLSRARDGLLRRGIIIAPERGKVRFTIPYLRDFVKKQQDVSTADKLVEEWDV